MASSVAMGIGGNRRVEAEAEEAEEEAEEDATSRIRPFMALPALSLELLPPPPPPLLLLLLLLQLVVTVTLCDPRICTCS